MDTTQLRALFDQQQRYAVESLDSRREVTPDVVRHLPLPGHGRQGFILHSRLTAAAADRVIAEQVAYFGGLGLSFEWKLYGHDTPSDLGERLAAQGFQPEDPESVLVLDLAEAPPALWAPVTQDVRRITAPVGLGDVVAIKEAVWGAPSAWLGVVLAHELAHPDDLTSVYVAYADGAPASTAWVRFHPPTQFASLWGGSTLPAFRGRGLYTALLAVRAQEAQRRGFRFLTVDASAMSRPILQHHGFRFLTTTTPYNWQPAETDA